MREFRLIRVFCFFVRSDGREGRKGWLMWEHRVSTMYIDSDTIKTKINTPLIQQQNRKL